MLNLTDNEKKVLMVISESSDETGKYVADRSTLRNKSSLVNETYVSHATSSLVRRGFLKVTPGRRHNDLGARPNTYQILKAGWVMAECLRLELG